LLKCNTETIQVAECKTCFSREPHAFRGQRFGHP